MKDPTRKCHAVGTSVDSNAPKSHENQLADVVESQSLPVPPPNTPPSTVQEFAAHPVRDDATDPLSWLFSHEKNQGKGLSAARESASLVERVLARRLLAEAKGETYDERLAERLAWHIVMIASKGEAVECSPVTLAYYRVVGCHEDQFYERRIAQRQSLLGERPLKFKPSARRGHAAEPAGAGPSLKTNPKPAPVPISKRKETA